MPRGSTRRRFLLHSVAALAGARLVPVHQIAAAVPQAPPRFPASLRATLATVADTIIPASGRMPAASAAGAVRYLEGAAYADKEFGQSLRAALDLLEQASRKQFKHSLPTVSPEQRAALLSAIEKSTKDPGSFALLRDAVYEAYYTNPKVWSLIGYRFRTGAIPTARIGQVDEAILQRVRKMPRLYRDI